MGLNLLFMKPNVESPPDPNPHRGSSTTTGLSTNSSRDPAQLKILTSDQLLEIVKASKFTISEAKKAISSALHHIDVHERYFSEACWRSSHMLLRYRCIRELYEAGKVDRLRQLADGKSLLQKNIVTHNT